MKRCRKYYLLLILILATAGTMTSQIIFDTLTLREFEIIATLDDLKSPTKVTSIDSIIQKELSLYDIGELLSLSTPVFVKSYGKGSLATVSFRGTGASHTKVVWEGFDINSPMLGQTDFSTLPVSLFNNIELHYGGSSLTDVGGALGGSVKLNTKPANHEDETLKVLQSIGSYNTYLTAATLNLGTSRLGSRTHFTRQSSKNDFCYFNSAILPSAVEMRQKNADFENYSLTQQFDFSISENQKISATSWNQWNSRNIPPIMTNVEKGGYQDEYQNDNFSRNVIKWSLNNKSTTWDARAAYFYENLNYKLETTDTTGELISQIDSKNKVMSYSAAANVKTHLTQKINLKAGIKYLNQEVISNNYDGSKKRIQYSNHIGLSILTGSRIKSEILLRSDVSDGKFTPIMPMIGVNYKPILSRDLYLRINFSRNYNLPSLNDLYWYPGGNDSLLPEKSLEAEFSADYSFKIKGNHDLTIRSTGYISSVENWIIWTPGDFRYWSPQNISNVLSRGIELSIIAKGIVSGIDYNIFIEYAYTRTTNNSNSAKDEGIADVQLIYVPINNANSFINLGFKGYYFNWGVSFTDTRNTSLNNTDNDSFTLPSFTLHNTSLGKRGKISKVKYDIRFKVYNVFNIDYQSVLWRAMPGRNFEFSLGIII